MMKTPDFLNEAYEFIPLIGNNSDMFQDVAKQLKLRMPEQVLLALVIYKYYEGQDDPKSFKILKSKLKDWFEFEKDGDLPPYAVYELLRIIQLKEDLCKDTLYSKSISEYIKKQNPEAMKFDYMHVMEKNNRTTSLYKFENDSKNASDFKFVEK